MKKQITLLSVTVTLFFIAIFRLSAQEQGALPFKKYSYKEYQGTNTVWSVFQDREGFMYAGTAGSLVQYDGKNWRTAIIDKPNVSPRHFYQDSSGRVYAFGDNILGYFSSTTKGELLFKQLINKLPKKAQNYSIGTRIMPTTKGLFFASVEYLAKWNGKEFKVWYPPKTSFTRSFLINDDIYVRENGTGIYLFDKEKETFNYIKGSSLFGTERISFMEPSENGKIIIGSRTKGFFIYNPSETDSTKSIIAISTKADEIIKTKYTYDCFRMKNGNLLICLFTGGVIEVTKTGEFVRFIYQTNDFVTSVYIDRNGLLWLGTNDEGIMRIDINSPYTIWKGEDKEKLNTLPNWLRKHKGNLYAGGITSTMIYKNGKFVPLSKNITQVFNPIFFEAEGETKLIVGHFDGVSELVDDQVVSICQGLPVNQVFTHPDFPNRLFVYDRGGVYTVLYQKGKWIKEPILKSFQNFRFISGQQVGISFNYEKATKELWATTNAGFLRINWKNPQEIDKPTIIQISTSINLQNFSVTFDSQERIIFQDNGIFYSFNSNKNIFEPIDFLGNNYGYKAPYAIGLTVRITDEKYITVINKQEGKLLNFDHFDLFTKQKDGSYLLDSMTYKYLPKQPAIGGFFESDSIAWITYNDFLMRYDLRKSINIATNFRAYIRELSSDKNIICGGVFCGADSIATYLQNEKDIIELDYKNNDISIKFAAPYYTNEESTTFSYLLEGANRTNWSDWTTENKKEYTNLKEGTYIFKVKAKNVFGKESNITSYKFIINPPWYRTWWAYLIYIVAITATIWGLIYWNTRRLLAAKVYLEQLVRERTSEIEKQKTEIEAQRDNLVELNEEINQQREEIMITAENLRVANNEVTKKNEDIVASINYARKIQFAMLPFAERIAESVGEGNFFVLYKPKDIVSGDFYFFEEIANQIFIAVADCTGHGVPGAFMSMIGNQLLHEIIVRDDIHQPNEVLNKLHIEIRRALQQNQTSTQDGMDISLVIIDKLQRCFHYAGAMNQIYYVNSENNGVLHELKADKRPIGGRQFMTEEERKFTNHTINLAENHTESNLETNSKNYTTLYLFSDGYCDQFGGTEGKKYMVKQFKTQLLTIHDKPMIEQHNILDNTITNWMQIGKEKQLDDILVFGIRF